MTDSDELTKLKAEYKAKALQYERKLATLTAMNSALQSENDSLRSNAAKAHDDGEPTDAEEELAELREEFARRLGHADKTVAELREEREKLRAQLKVVNQSGSAIEGRLQERDATIAKLQAEGESLARKNGQLEATLRKTRQQLQDAAAERDRAESRAKAAEAHCLSAQEQAATATEQAAEQIEALEAEITELRQSARKQVAEAQREAADAARQLQAAQERADATVTAQAQSNQQALLQQLSELQESLTLAERATADTEARLEGTIRELQQQLAEVARQREEQEMALADATKPLFKQIEALTLAAAAQQEAQAAAEAAALARCRAAEAAAADAADAERAAKAKAQASEGLLRAAKQAVADAVATSAELASKLEAERRRAATLATEKAGLEERLAGMQAALTRQHDESQRDLRELEERLWESESRARQLLLERDALQDALSQPSSSNHKLPSLAAAASTTSNRTPLPPDVPDAPLSSALRQGSVASSAAQSEEALDELFSGREASQGSLFIAPSSSPRCNGSDESAMEQLRILLRKAHAARDELSQQLLAAYEEVAQLKTQVKSIPSLEADIQVLHERLDLAMEVLGERTSRVTQLEEDIADMKTIFREQLEEAVAQLEAARNASKAAAPQPLTDAAGAVEA